MDWTIQKYLGHNYIIISLKIG